jgi:protein-tyrosine kinase
MTSNTAPFISAGGVAPVGNIGKSLLERGKITEAQAEKILLFQKERGIRFGEAALDLGFITQKDIADVLSEQFAYPYLRKGESALDEKLAAAYSPFTPQVEALRSLRTQLMLRWFSQGNKIAQLVGYETGIGASLTVANLGIVFSQLGERTLVIDGNLRKPYQHTLFGKTNDAGLTDILAGRATLDCVQKIESLVGLSLLSAGTPAPNPQELLGRPQLAKTMASFAANYDVVLVDSAPLSFSSDAQLLGAVCKGLVLVSRIGVSKARDTVRLHKIVQTTGAQVIGVILTEW